MRNRCVGRYARICKNICDLFFKTIVAGSTFSDVYLLYPQNKKYTIYCEITDNTTQYDVLYITDGSFQFAILYLDNAKCLAIFYTSRV